MEIKNIQINEVNPASYNPREISHHAFTALCESLKKFGLQQPLIINEKTNTLISGHQRLKAAEALNFDTVPVIYVSLSEAEEKAFNITLNNSAIGGDFTEGIKNLLAEIKTDLGDDYVFDLNLDETLEAVDCTLKEFEKPEIEEPPEEVEKKFKVEEGDLFQLGRHYLVCGNSLDEEVRKRLLNLNRSKETLTFTDPPYELDLQGKTKKVFPFDHLVLQSSMKQIFTLFQEGWEHRFEFVYVFGTPTSYMNKSRPYYNHKLGAYLSRNRKSNLFHCDNAKDIRSLKGFWSTVIKAEYQSEKKIHGHAKPVQSYVEALSGFKFDAIFDPFSGSGTSFLAAEFFEKPCFGIELETHNCELILDRWASIYGETTINKIEG